MSWMPNLNIVTLFLMPITGLFCSKRGRVLLILLGSLLLVVESWAQAGPPSEIEFCLINPQKNKSLESLILEIEPRPQVQAELKHRAQILNSSRSLDVPVKSYTQILSWNQRPSKAWAITHCYRVGYVSEEVLAQTPMTIWSSLSTKSLRFIDIETLYSSKETPLIPIESVSFSSTPVRAQDNAKAQNPNSQKTTNVDNVSSSAMSKHVSPPDLQQTLKKKQTSKEDLRKYEWKLSLGLLSGTEFSNAKGMGIVDEISLLTAGIEIGTSKHLTDWLSLYGKYRHVFVINAEEQDLVQSDLAGEYDRQVTLGFDLHLSGRFRLGASVKESRWLLYQRTVPIFILESFREQLNIGALKFEWIFNESSWGQWGLVGIYGKGLGSTDEYRAKDYHTALVLKNQKDVWAYEFAFAYELNSYKYGSGVASPSSIAEINRNRYLFTVQMEF